MKKSKKAAGLPNYPFFFAFLNFLIVILMQKILKQSTYVKLKKILATMDHL